METFNDLVGLRYGWGHRPGDGSGMTDCFMLVCEVRRRLGLTDYQDRFLWAYDRFTEATLPRSQVARWALSMGRRVRPAGRPCAGLLALFPGALGVALGTTTDYGVLFICAGGAVVHSPLVQACQHLIEVP